MKNLGLKILSLVIAVGLSYFVNSENYSSIIRFTVPVEIKNLPSDKILLSSLSSGVQVTVKGPSYLVKQAVDSNLTFKAHIPETPPDSFVLDLRESDLALPDSLKVLSIDPAEIEIKLDDKMVKDRIPVIVPRLGSIEEGLVLGGILIEPNHVTVTGPASEVKNIKRIETEPIKLDEIKTSTVKKLYIRAPGPRTILNVEKVSVDIKVTSVQEERKFKSLPIEVRSSVGMSYVVNPQRVNVELSGPRKIIRSLKPEQVVPYVRVNRNLKNGDRVRIKVDLPRGTVLVVLEPKRTKIVGVLSSKQEEAVRSN